MIKERDYALVFVCQQGRLEVQASLLAASLRRNLRIPHELIAAVPVPSALWGELSHETAALLDELGVRVVELPNHLELGREFTHSNKFACLDLSTKADTLVFLDSDMLCMREFGEGCLPDVPLALKPVDVQRYTGRRAWRQTYAAVGMATPGARLPATVSGELGPPHFNSGFIAVRPGLGLGAAWRETVATLRADQRILRRAPHSDQPGLAVAIHRLGIPYTCLDERFNFPLRLRRLADGPPPWFVHYGSLDTLQTEPQLSRLIAELVDQWPRLGSLMGRGMG